MPSTIKMPSTAIKAKKLTGTTMRANIQQRKSAMASRVSNAGVYGLVKRESERKFKRGTTGESM